MDMFYNIEKLLLTNTGIILLAILFHVNGKQCIPAHDIYKKIIVIIFKNKII
jgi:hypothetical protein